MPWFVDRDTTSATRNGKRRIEMERESEMDEETREAIGQRAMDGAVQALSGAGFSGEQETALAQAISSAVLEALDEWMNTYYEIEEDYEEEGE